MQARCLKQCPTISVYNKCFLLLLLLLHKTRSESGTNAITLGSIARGEKDEMAFDMTPQLAPGRAQQRHQDLSSPTR